MSSDKKSEDLFPDIPNIQMDNGGPDISYSPAKAYLRKAYEEMVREGSTITPHALLMAETAVDAVTAADQTRSDLARNPETESARITRVVFLPKNSRGLLEELFKIDEEMGRTGLFNRTISIMAVPLIQAGLSIGDFRLRSSMPSELGTSWRLLMRVMLPRDEYDEVLGDIEEAYHLDVQEFGVRAAGWIRRKTAFGYVPSTIGARLHKWLASLLGYIVGAMTGG